MPKIKRPVSINGIEFDALMEETITYNNDVPTYPVEHGFPVSDSIINQPRTFDLVLILTETPVTWKKKHKIGAVRLNKVLKKLEKLYFARTLVTLKTPDRIYKNLAIVNMTLGRTSPLRSMEIPITLQDVDITKSKKTTIPDSYGKSGKTGENAGAANVTEKKTSVTSAKSHDNTADSAKNKGNNASTLYNAAKLTGIVK